MATNGAVSASPDARPARGRDLREVLGQLVRLDNVRGGLFVAQYPDHPLTALYRQVVAALFP